ncbi:MAG: tRNA (adenosine(37)-N6)-dimethylallyltransferase MiaA, partial [Coprococcus sp.]
MDKKPLVILTGPTAVGKTDLSISLAKNIGGEIISADSMQVYRKMNIGTAKIKPEEMCGVPHYLIDVLDPSDNFNVVIFKQMALSAMENIYSHEHIPIIVGGTGFYIQALLYDIQFEENDDDMAYREELARCAALNGNEYLHAMLADIDKASAEKIHPNNVKRVIRAL